MKKRRNQQLETFVEGEVEIQRIYGILKVL